MKKQYILLVATALCRAATIFETTGVVNPTYSWDLTSQTAAGVYFDVLQPVAGPLRLEVQVASPVARTINAILTTQANPYDPNLNIATGTLQSAASANPNTAAVSPVVALTISSLSVGPHYLILYTAANDAVWQGFFPYTSTAVPAIGLTGFLVTDVNGAGFDANNPPASTFYGVNGPAFGFRIVTDDPVSNGNVPEPGAMALTALGVTALLLRRRRR